MSQNLEIHISWQCSWDQKIIRYIPTSNHRSICALSKQLAPFLASRELSQRANLSYVNTQVHSVVHQNSVAIRPLRNAHRKRKRSQHQTPNHPLKLFQYYKFRPSVSPPHIHPPASTRPPTLPLFQRSINTLYSIVIYSPSWKPKTK